MSEITSEELRKLIGETIPAPWKYEQDQADPEWFIVTITGGLIVANVNAHSRQEANARLIAATPDLAAELLALRERSAQLLNYCSATVRDLQSTLTTLEALDLSAELPRTVASLKDASEFMRLAAENAEDPSKWQDEISVRNTQIAELRKANERQQEMAGKMVEALRFYADPAIYKPHPHGPAFDDRDVSFKARAVLSEWEAHNG